MSDSDTAEAKASDESLVERTRSGDQSAFAELWRRHYRSGARVARQFTSIDADDLVSEAFLRIYQRVLAGGGPVGAFRPYLYTAIRNLASSWGAANKDVQVDDIADFQDPATLDDPVAVALDRTLTVRAFRNLPDRWQSVLWYTEVEGMDPHEVAPIMGMTANGVAALSYRAREGLRKAWLQAHINDASGSGECQWTITRIGDHARNALTARDTARMNDHLATCAKCSIINEEVDEVGSRLALVMLPLLLGGAAGGTLLASLGHAGSAVAAAIPAAPVLPAVPVLVGTSAGATVALGTPALVGTLALVVVLGGAAIVAAPQDQPVTSSASSSSETSTSAVQYDGAGDGTVFVPADDPTSIPDSLLGEEELGETIDTLVDGVGEVVGGVGTVAGGVVDGVVEPVVESIVPPELLTTDITITGTAVPGTTVTATVAGLVSTTVAASNGTFALTLAGVPQDSGTIQLGGTLLGLPVPLGLDSVTGGLLVHLLN